MKRYSPWILAPLVVLAGMLLVLSPERRGGAGGFDDFEFVRDRSVGRTVRTFQSDQGSQTPTTRPLREENREGLNVDIEIDATTWDRMLYPTNRAVYRDRATNVRIRFGDRPARPATVRLRGGGSLTMPGKPSFNVKLLHAEEFAPGVVLEHFYLSNTRYDRPGVKLRFGYSLLSDFGLFSPHVQYARVTVNGSYVGIYLLVEPPEGAIRRTNPDCTAVHRRWAANRFERLWSQRVPLQNKRIDGLVSLGVTSDSDTGIVAAYDETFDVDQFLTWLAINSAVANNDTTDELFLYETRDPANRESPGRLHVMGWDFEDILTDKPAPGYTSDPLLHVYLDAHERHVARNPVLRERLREKLARLIESELSPDRLIERLHATQAQRDALDDEDGRDARLTPQAVNEAKAARATFVKFAEEIIRRRHAQLQLATALPSTQPG